MTLPIKALCLLVLSSSLLVSSAPTPMGALKSAPGHGKADYLSTIRIKSSTLSTPPSLVPTLRPISDVTAPGVDEAAAGEPVVLKFNVTSANASDVVSTTAVDALQGATADVSFATQYTCTDYAAPDCSEAKGMFDCLGTGIQEGYTFSYCDSVYGCCEYIEGLVTGGAVSCTESGDEVQFSCSQYTPPVPVDSDGDLSLPGIIGIAAGGLFFVLICVACKRVLCGLCFDSGTASDSYQRC